MRHDFPRRALNLSKIIRSFISPALILAFSGSGFAGPEGGEVVGGTGSINRSGNTTTINQATDRMAIDWQTYDVGANERVQYIQPDSSSISLNRILSNRGSQIHGQIDANGHVFLVNPNGVFFGENSVINVGGMLASGLSIEPSDFMNGDFAFSAIEGTDGLVINAGLINAATGGNVALIGQQVENEGMISAQLGSVALAAGREAVVTFDGEGLLGVQVTESILQEDIGVDAAVINSGEISAEDGQILISAAASQDIFSQAVNSGEVKQATSVVVGGDGSFTLSAGANVVNTGVLSASGDAGGAVVLLGENVTSSGEVRADSSVGYVAGSIELHSVGTTLLAENSEISAISEFSIGGDIKILGNRVGVLDRSSIDVSGAAGGGRVFIGGDYHGDNSYIQNSDRVVVGEDVNIRANALVDGNGGRIVLWSDDATSFYGQISAVGGAFSGGGGFVEVSGKEALSFWGGVDIGASFGDEGTLLLDPRDIRIVSSGSDNIRILDREILFGDGDTDDDFTISASSLVSALSGGDVILEARDDIDFQTSVDASGNTNHLELYAGDDIYFEQSGTTIDLGSGNLTAVAGTSGCVGCSGPGGKGRSVFFTNSTVTTTGTINIYAAQDVFFHDSATTNSVNDQLTVVNAGVLNVESRDDIFIHEDAVINAGQVSFSGGVSSSLFTVTPDLTVTGTVDLDGLINTSGGDFGSISTVYDASSTSLIDSRTGASTSDSGEIDIQSSSSTDILNLGAIVSANGNECGVGGDEACGDISVISGFGIADLGLFDINGTALFSSSGNNINLDNTLHTFTGLVSADTSGVNTDENGGAITLSGVDIVVGTVSSSGSTDGTDSDAGDIVFNVSNSFEASATSVITAVENGGGTAGTLTVNGDGNDNTLTLSSGASWAGGAVSINGLAGDDTFEMFSSIAASVDGGAETAGDTLFGPDQENDWQVTDANIGTLNGNAFAEIENLTGNDNDDDFTINDGGSISGLITGGDAADTDTADYSGVLSAINIEVLTGIVGVEFIEGNDHVDSELSISTGTNTWAFADFDGLPGDDTVSNGVDDGTLTSDQFVGSVQFVNFQNIIGGDGADAFTFTTDTIATSSGSIDGGSAAGNSIQGRTGVDSTWDIDSANSGSVTDTTNSDEVYVADFDNIQNLVGQTGDDDFIFSDDASISGLVNGGDVGGDTDTLDYSLETDDPIYIDLASGVSGTANIESYTGNGTDSTLVGENNGNLWTITDENDGHIDSNTISFTDFNILIGGTDADDFVIEDGGSITGSIQGGDDLVDDSITGRSLASTYTLTIDTAPDPDEPNGNIVDTSSGSVTYVADFRDINVLTGNSSADVLIGRDQENHWNFTSSEFSVGNNEEPLSATDLVEFTSMETVRGNNNTDIFNVSANVVANIHGGDGADVFNILTPGVSATIFGGDTDAEVDVIFGWDGDSSQDALNQENNLWTISGAGFYLDNDTDISERVTFSEIETIQGGEEVEFSPPSSIYVGGIDEFTISTNFSGTINGRSGDDRFDVTLASDVTGGLNGGDGIETFNLSADLTGGANGDADADVFNILAPGINAVIDGGSTGTDSDTIHGWDDNASVNYWRIESGGLELDNEITDSNTSFVGFSDIEIIDGADDSDASGDGQDQFDISTSFDGSINGGSGSDTFNVTSIASVSGGLSGGEGGDSFDIDAILTGIVSGGNGVDIIDLSASVTTVNAGGGNDQITIDGALTSTINGEGGQDQFILASGGTVIGSINGGAENDTFTVNQAQTAAQLNGEAGNDIFNLNQSVSDGTAARFVVGGDGDDTFNVVAGISVNIDGSEGNESTLDTITLTDTSGSYTWALTDADIGSLGNIDFIGVENINGSNGGVDTFEFGFSGRYEGIADGWLGTDIVDLSGVDGGNVAVSLGSDINFVQNATVVKGAGINSSFTVISGTTTDEPTIWTISDFDGAGEADGTNDGVVSNDGNTTQFIDFGILVGNEEADQFTVQSGASIVSVNGNETTSTNTLTYLDGSDNNWVLTGTRAGTINTTDLVFFNILSIAGTGDDNLQARNSQTNVWQFNTTSGGTVADTSASDLVTFSGFDDVTGGNERDEFNVNNGVDFGGTISGANGNDIFYLVDDVLTGINGGAGDDDFHVTNALLSVSVNGDGGDDELYVLANNVDVTFSGGANTDYVIGVNDAVNQNNWNVNTDQLINAASPSAIVDFSGVEELVGGSGADVFTVSASITRSLTGTSGNDTLVGPGATNEWLLTSHNTGTLNTTVSFSAIDVITGGAGTDTLTGINQNNDWQITGSNAGYVEEDGSGDGRVDFTLVEELVGGTLNDTFTVGASGVIDSIDGGESVGDDDTIVGRTTANTWNITNSNLGNLQTTAGPTTYVTSFTNIETLEGSNTEADIFDFAVFANVNIDAGASVGDVAEYSDVASDVAITIGAGGVDGLTGIEEVVGNNDGLLVVGNSSTLTLDASVAAQWDISDANGGDGINDGDVTFGGDTVIFTNFSDLVGGSGDDTFNLNPAIGNSGISGSITGGGESTADIITVRNTTTTWDISEDNSGGAGNEFSYGDFTYLNGTDDGSGPPPVALFSNTDFSGIETINGSDSGDTYTVNPFTLGGGFTLSLNAGLDTDSISFLNTNLDVTLGQAVGGLSLEGFETITANSAGTNILRSTSTSGASVVWAIDGLNAGTVGGVRFVDFQTIIAGNGNDQFTFSATGEIETLLDGGSGSNEIVANSTLATRWDISGTNSGAVYDNTVTSAPVLYVDNFQNIQTLTGSGVSNAFNMTSTGTFAGTLTGGSGADTITVTEMASQDTLWLIDPSMPEDGTVQRADSSDNTSVTSSAVYTEIETLTGGDGVDKFVFSGAGTFTGSANAGAGTDIVDLSGVSGTVSASIAAANVHGIAGVERFIGNGANSTLSGLDSGTNTWTISDFDVLDANPELDGANDGVFVNGGTTLQFINVNTLEGSDTATDEFVFEVGGSIDGRVEGGAGLFVDTVTGPDNTSANQWTVTTALAGNVNSSDFVEIDRLIGGSGTGEDYLRGRVQENNWTINAFNEGYVEGSDSSDRVTFVGMENLEGNSDNDHFVFATTGSLTGTIDADIGASNNGDTISVSSDSDDSVEWTLNGSASGIITGFLVNGFSDIEVVNGGAGQDNVLVSSAFSGAINTLANSDRIQLGASVGGDIDTGAGDDVIEIDDSTAAANIIAGTGTDEIRLDHTDGSDWLIDSNDGGRVTSTALVTFDGIEIITGNGGVDDVSVESDFDGSISTLGGNDEIALLANVAGGVAGGTGGDLFEIAADNLTTDINGTSGSNDRITVTHSGESVWTIDGSNTVDSVTFSNMDVLNGNGAADTVTVETASAHQINTLGGNDTVYLEANVADLNTGADDDTINIVVDGITADVDGGTDTTNGDTLAITHGGESTWNIAASNTVDNVTFSDIENVVGNNQRDRVIVLAGFDSINTAGGNDILDLSANVDTILLGAGTDEVDINVDGITVTSMNGGGDSDTLTIAHSSESAWNIDTASSVDTVNFEGFDILIGNDEIDTMTVTGAFAGTISTNGGNDDITLSANVGQLNTGANEDRVLITNALVMASINAGGSSNDILTGPTRSSGLYNDWQITSSTEVTLNGLVTGQNFENYVGGLGEDRFELSEGASADEIRGIASGVGADTAFNTLIVNHGSGTVQWRITGDNQGQILGNIVDDFYDIENLTGGAGVDTFTYTAAISAISGLIDGGEDTSPDGNDDTLDITALQNGVVVELGPTASVSPVAVSGRSALVVNVNNIEEITAFNGTDAQEAQNWVAVTHTNGVRWDFSDGVGSAVINEGTVLELDGGNQIIADTLVTLHNFGSLQGGVGFEDEIDITSETISGEHVRGSGERSLSFTGTGLVVVDIDSNIVNLTGNNNLLLRVSAGSEFDGTVINNDWLINEQNAGTFSGDVDGAATFSFDFTGVNRFEGGVGNDEFIISENASLIDGALNGGGGFNQIIIPDATNNLAFGVSQISATPSVPEEYYPSSSIPPVFLLVDRAATDGITEIFNINDVNAMVLTSEVSLYSATTGTFEWDLVDAGNTLTNSDTFSVLSFNGVDRVVGGAANDIFDVDSLTSVVNEFDGGVGTDVVNVEDIVSSLMVSTDPLITTNVDIQIANIETLTSTDNNNTLVGGAASNVWNLTSVNDGSLNYNNGAGTTTVSYTNFSHLVGGAGQDQIAISDVDDDDGSSSDWGTINGGGSLLDSLTVSADGGLSIQINSTDIDGNVIDSVDTVRLDVAGIEQIDANGAHTNYLYGRVDTENDWDINTVDHSVAFNADTVTFSNFQNLTGGDDQDEFTFNGEIVSGLVRGGSAGNDVVNLQNLDDTVVHIGDRVTTDFNIVDVEDINATGSGYVLRADDQLNVWTIRNGADDLLNAITFDGFSNIVGGSGDDTLTVNVGVDITLYDAIDGGVSGEDTLDISAIGQDLRVSLDSAAPTADLYLSNIDEVDANNAQNNELIASNITNVWDIDGTNAGTLNSGTANEVAFSGFANLTGSDQQDTFNFGQVALSVDDVVTGLIDGAGGTTDILNVSDMVDGVVIELGDTLTVDNPNTALTNLHANNVESINAFNDVDEANAPDEEANNWLVNNMSGDFRWDINARNGGSITPTSGQVINPITFSNFAYVEGTDNGVDEFHFVDGGVVTSQFVGGDGLFDDLANFSLVLNSDIEIAVNSSSTQAINFAGLERVIGNNDGSSAILPNSTLRVESGVNTWTIDGVNDGDLDTAGDDIAFENFNIIVGGTGADLFDINGNATITGSINGGANTISTDLDVIDATDVIGDVDIQVDGTTFGILNVSDVEEIRASGTNNTIRAADVGDANWLVSNVNRGTLNSALEFIGFDNLVGSTGVDHFVLEQNGVVDSVAGGLATGQGDILEVQSSSGDTWIIDGVNEGSVSTRVSDFSSIENVIGGEGADSFTLANSTASISGLIDGGESSDLVDANIDSLDLQALGAGVVVELGADASDVPNFIAGRETYARVNANNFESITAADTGATEDNNWLAITHDNGVRWNFSAGLDNGLVINEGYVVELALSDASEVANTQVDLHNFGSLQGGVGFENAINVIEDNTISGLYVAGSGLRTLSYSGNGLVVVDIDSNIEEVQGNNNLLLRVAEGSEFVDFNNDWLINAENAGTFTADAGGTTDYSFDFTGVNQFEGGSGNDAFTFADSGSLIDGTINGGAGNNTIDVATVTADLSFGIGQIDVNPASPAAVYPEVGIPPVYLVLNRALTDGVTEIVGIQTLSDSDVASRVTLYSGSVLNSNSVWMLDTTQSTLEDSANNVDLTFTGVVRVVGGATNDTFNVLALNVVEDIFDGGEGTDSVNLTNLSSDVSVLLNNSLASGDVYVSNVENVSANPDANLSNTLIGMNEDSTWDINGINTGEVEGITFDGFNTLTGGTGDDRFVLDGADQVSGLITGGDGTDELDISGIVASTRVAIGNTIDADLNVSQIETISATSNDHELIAANDDNIWNIAGRDAGQLVSAVYDIDFSGFANLTGGDGADTFNLNRVLNVNDEVSGVIRGGANGGNQVNIDGLTDVTEISVALGTENVGTLNVVDIQTIDAANGDFKIIGDNVSNTWTIQGENTGLINSVAFSGFGFLEGGTDDDLFVLARQDGATEDDRITGMIDGGGDPVVGSSTNRVDLTGLLDSVSVSFDSTYVTADIQLAQIDEVDANNSNINTLVGEAQGNNWDIDTQNAGELNGTTFSGFSNLIGRDFVDTFSFTDTGSVAGFVDGGSQPIDGRDVADLSALSDVHVVIGDSTAGFLDIEEYRGNGDDAIITAENIENTWTIDAENAGSILDENGNQIAFSNFGILEGGSDDDTFMLNGGSVTGEIIGGQGDDELNVTIVSGVNGGVMFRGGEGQDDLLVDGGAVGYEATYTPNSDGSAVLAYTFQDETSNVSYDVGYEAVESVEDNVIADVFTINDLNQNTDQFVLEDGSFTLNGAGEVEFSNKDSLEINTEAADSLQLDGQIVLNNRLSVTGAAVSAVDATTEVQALEVVFNRNQVVGAANQPIRVDTETLILESVIGDVYIQEASDLVIAGLNNPGGITNIVAAGSITDGAVITANEDIYLQSLNGDIVLDNANAMTGIVNLSANAQVTINNTVATTLGDVNAQNMTLTVNGNLADNGDIDVSGTTAVFANGNNVIFDNINNDFDVVNVAEGGDVVLTDIDDITVSGTASDLFDVTAAQDIQTSGAIVAEDILLNAVAGDINANNNLVADNSIALTGGNITVNGELTVNDSLTGDALTINARGDVDLLGQINTVGVAGNAGSVVIDTNQFTQRLGADITSGNVEISSATSVNQGADIFAEGSVIIAGLNGDVVMAAGVTTEGTDINVSASDNLEMQALSGTSLSLVADNVTQDGALIASESASITAENRFEVSESGTVTVADGSFAADAAIVEISGDVNVGTGLVTLTSSANTVVDAEISGGGLSVTSGQAIAMAANGQITVTDSVLLDAQGNIGLTEINANSGEVTLITLAALTDNNGSSVNVLADRLNIESGTGIGASGAFIETQISQLSARNSSGEANILNSGDVIVYELLSGGDIRFENTIGDVTLQATEGELYDPTEGLSPIDAGGVMNAGYEFGALSITVADGDLIAAPVPGADKRRPDLVGDRIEVFVPNGDFAGTEGRTIIAYARTSMFISAQGGVRPEFAFDIPPTEGLQGADDLLDSSFVSSVSDLLVDVESIEEVDPAVFTAVRNYSHDNISIRMPADQLYGDEYEEEEDGEEEFAL
ncbi:MAG: filamentous hemagglutinin N-terminal domain-containing protein [Agarilytica sp.]